MDPVLLIVVAGAVLAALVLGWWLGGRAVLPVRGELAQVRGEVETLRGEAAGWRDRFNKSVVDLAATAEQAKRLPQLEADLDRARTSAAEAQAEAASLRPLATRAQALDHELSELRAEKEALVSAKAAHERGETERQRAHDAQIAQLQELRAQLETQFGALARQAMDAAQEKFLRQADEKLGTTGKQNAQKLEALLQPVEATLKRYEEGLRNVEKERVGHYESLREAVEQVKVGQAEVKAEAAKLSNALRAAPKTRGRWGEQQFKNLIEISGLSSFVDFEEEVSIATDDGALRPDFIIRLPGDQQLVVDVKCSLDAYLRATDCTDHEERRLHLADHGRAVSTHVDALARKSYWDQFPKAPDFVIMYIPGDNFIAAALEADLELWERAAKRRVIICGPSTFLPMARTVAGIWRQEKLAEEAQKIGLLGKEMYDRLAVAADKLRTVGGGLNTAVKNYNEFVSSFETRVLVTGRRFRDLNVETGSRELREVEPVEALPRYGQAAAGPLLIEELPREPG